MAEKADLKKGQPKHQKSSKQNNVKGNKNEVKNQNKQLYFLPNQKKKYIKGQKGVKYGNNNLYRNLKKKKDDKSFIVVFLTWIFYILSPLIILYVVDFDKFTKVRDGANYCLNKTVSFLPHAVVKQGELAVEYIRPVADVTVDKLNIFLNNTSTFFNTNPLIKDHWINIREISSICSARLVDYMRTLYLQTTGYCLDFKNKLF